MAQQTGLLGSSDLIPIDCETPLPVASDGAMVMDTRTIVDAFPGLELADTTTDTEGPKTIVVGIDFGTTYSGVSWAIFDQADWKVQLINKWPRSGLDGDTHISPKVPSLVSYAPDGRPGPISWGFAAKDPFVDWFKLQLDPSHEHARKRNTIHGNASGSREAERTTVDYLQSLWTHAEETIRAHMPPGARPLQHIFRVVLTVPAMWEPSAKEKIKSLALRAGIPGLVMMINEPEAAAIAGFRKLAENQYSFERGDIFVVCDAGGGTVDLITYNVENPDPLVVKECVSGTGGICGAVFIDVAFENVIKCKLGDEFYAIDAKARNKISSTFIDKIKMTFNHDSRQEIPFIRMKSVSDNPMEGIVNGWLELGLLGGHNHDPEPWKSDTCRTIFDAICDKVVGLVEAQVDATEEQGKAVKTVLLAGGFGDNKYLEHRIRTALAWKQSVRVSQIDEAWSAVCRGATMWGLQQLSHLRSGPGQAAGGSAIPTVARRFPPSSFGIKLDNGEMVWLVEARHRYANGSRTSQTITKDLANMGRLDRLLNKSTTMTHTLWSCNTGNNPPPVLFSRLTMREVCTISHTLKNPKLYRVQGGWIELDMAVELRSASLKFFVVSRDKKVQENCEAEYHPADSIC